MQLADVRRHQSHPCCDDPETASDAAKWVEIMLMRSTLTMIVIWEWWKITCVWAREMREIFIMEFYNSIKTSFIAPRLDSRALQHFRYYLKMHPLSVSCFSIFSFAHTGCVSLSCYLSSNSFIWEPLVEKVPLTRSNWVLLNVFARCRGRVGRHTAESEAKEFNRDFVVENFHHFWIHPSTRRWIYGFNGREDQQMDCHDRAEAGRINLKKDSSWVLVLINRQTLNMFSELETWRKKTESEHG